MTDLQNYKHPYVTVDVVLFAITDGNLAVYLSKRQQEPYKGTYSLQGSFMHEGETTDATVERVINEKTGCKNVYFEQLATFSEIGRDPREWTITVAYIGITDNICNIKNDGNSSWFIIEEADTGLWLNSIDEKLRLSASQIGFEHGNILKTAIGRIKGKISYTPIGLYFTKNETTIPELKSVYKAVLGKDFSENNFARDILAKQFTSTGILRATKQYSKTAKSGRPSTVYVRQK